MNRNAPSLLVRSLLALAVGGICLGIPVLAEPPQTEKVKAIWTMEEAEEFLKSGHQAVIVRKAIPVRRVGDKYEVGTDDGRTLTLTREQMRLALRLQAAANRTLKADYVTVPSTDMYTHSEAADDEICKWVEQPGNRGKTLAVLQGDDATLADIDSQGRVELISRSLEKQVYQQAGFTQQMEPVRHAARYTRCKSNMKNIATALEMYATDNAGHYPTSMAPLVPNYLRVIPSCPVSKSNDYPYQIHCAPDATSEAYTFYCKGNNHAAAKSVENYPGYSSHEGLRILERRNP